MQPFSDKIQQRTEQKEFSKTVKKNSEGLIPQIRISLVVMFSRATQCILLTLLKVSTQLKDVFWASQEKPLDDHFG